MNAGIVKVALGQIDISWEAKEKNKKTCEKVVRLAVARGADLVIFPEMTLTGCSKFGEPIKNSDTVSFFRRLALMHKINILFGVALTAGSSRKSGNRALVADKTGRIISTYQKIHPFSFSGENRYCEPGNKLSFFKINGLKFSLVICYDLRFPGMFEAISKKSTDAIVVIANWPQARIHHWKMLLAARALDTQSYMIGVNRVGKEGEDIYNGQSAVFDPTGQLLNKLSSSPSIFMVTLQKKVIDNYRKSFSSLRDKRPSIYSIL